MSTLHPRAGTRCRDRLETCGGGVTPGESVDLVYTPELSANSTGDSVVTLELLDGSSTTLLYVSAPEPAAALTAPAALSALAAPARSASR